MCIIAYVRKGVKLENDYLTRFHHRNPHGAGIAIWNDNERKWEVVKGLMTLEEIEDFMTSKKLVDTKDHPTFVIHFRYATAGSIIPELTHPFKITLQNDECIFFHNGVFRIDTGESYYYGSSYIKSYNNYQKFKSDESDTSLFCKKISQIKPTKEQLKIILQDWLLDDIISSSRLAVCFHGEEDPLLVGSWYEKNGLLLSNLYSAEPISYYEKLYSSGGSCDTGLLDYYLDEDEDIGKNNGKKKKVNKKVKK